MIRTLIRTDREYSITGAAPLWTGRSSFRPTSAHAWTAALGDEPTVVVKGPVIKKSGGESRSTGRCDYGTFGIPLAQAPEWVREIAADITRLDAQ